MSADAGIYDLRFTICDLRAGGFMGAAIVGNFFLAGWIYPDLVGLVKVVIQAWADARLLEPLKVWRT
jgi:hypothetical protein